MEFSLGDVVQLKSGGPHMTISVINPDRRIHTIWFVNDELKNGVFPPETLEKYVPRTFRGS
ncbi:YodC family protein [Pseudoroseomonas wenyumeiae]